MSDPIFVVLVAAIGGLFGSCLHLSLGWRSGFLISCGSIAFIAGLASKMAEVNALPAATGVVLACVVVLVHGVQYKHTFAMTVAYAPQLSRYGLDNFDRLDVDKDGIITLFDLWDAAESPWNSREDLIMIRLLERQLARIGHVIDTSIVVSPMSTGVVTVDHHGMSVSDLENYPDKIRSLYEQQFGEKLS
jgi:hypothetical protein